MSDERPNIGNEWDGKDPKDMNFSEWLAWKTGGWLDLPNVASASGLAMSGLGIYYFARGRHAEGTALFLGGRGMDVVDGPLAKLMHLRGKVGGYLDATFDKVALTAALVTLTYTGDMPPLATAGALVTQAGIAIENMRIHEAGGKATPNWQGKLTAFALSGAGISYMSATTAESMNRPVLAGALRVAGHIAMGASIASGGAAWHEYHNNATALNLQAESLVSE